MAYGPKRPDLKFLIDAWEKEIVWNDITIILRLNKSGNGGTLPNGSFMQHLEIQTKNNEPLPITDTGYKSHFFHGNLGKSVSDAVLDWINKEAESKKWQRYWKEREKALQQPDLFGDL